MTKPGLSCEQRQVRCQLRFWALLGANFLFTCSSFGWSWVLFNSGERRASVSEDRAAIAQREADRSQGRIEAIPGNFSAINELLVKIQNDLNVVKIAVARLEEQLYYAPAPRPKRVQP